MNRLAGQLPLHVGARAILTQPVVCAADLFSPPATSPFVHPQQMWHNKSYPLFEPQLLEG
jgi:hypothetical protein